MNAAAALIAGDKAAGFREGIAMASVAIDSRKSLTESGRIDCIQSKSCVEEKMILDKIVADVKINLAEKKKLVPVAEMKKRASMQPPPLDFAAALRGNRVRLIAEVKKASPSKGIICPDFNPVNIARIYADNGAAAISVLTEPKYFLGSLDYLRDIKKALAENPCLYCARILFSTLIKYTKRGLTAPTGFADCRYSCRRHNCPNSCS